MKKIILLAWCLMLAACAMPDVRQYQATEPKLNLVDYFLGTTDAWGMVQKRNGAVIGTAADVKGESVGVLAGNALHWQYTLLLPIDGNRYEVQFDDWMFLIDEHSMLNRSSMSKFGVELGQVTLFFRKRT